MSTSDQSPTRLRIRKTTFGFLGAAVVLAAAGLIVGISDNPPGIILLYLSSLALVLAVTHGWKDPRRFGVLFLSCVVGFVVLVVIHNFSEVGADRISHMPVLAVALSAVSVISFLLALFVCPWGCVVGAIGGIHAVDSRRRGEA